MNLLVKMSMTNTQELYIIANSKKEKIRKAQELLDLLYEELYDLNTQQSLESLKIQEIEFLEGRYDVIQDDINIKRKELEEQQLLIQKKLENIGKIQLEQYFLLENINGLHDFSMKKQKEYYDDTVNQVEFINLFKD